MKQSIMIFLGMLSLIFGACSDKDEIHADLGESWYDLTDDPSDPVRHYIYDFYQDYGIFILTDPAWQDYRFNFRKKNNIRVVSPAQNKELIQEGLEFVKRVFIDVYPDKFKKDFFPFNVILADSVLFVGMEDQTPSYHAFASTNFIAIAGIREGMKDYSPELLREIKGEVNGKFWADFLLGVKGVFQVPDEFYDISAKWYAQAWGDGETPDDIDFYEMGFVSYDPGLTGFDPDPDWGGWWVQAPTKTIDISQWLAFMFYSTPTEREGIFSVYPLMKKKYDILKEAMKKCGGFDVSTVK